MTYDEIFAKVRSILVEALNVEEQEVSPHSRLKADLNAESIDFLDIVFRLEKQFGLRIPREDLFPESIFQGDPRFVSNGQVTAEGLAELQRRMPYADLSSFRENPRLDRIEDLFTVDLIVRYLQSRLAATAPQS
ncbi:MAG: acyl carrier protein [Gemmataceae bacterium]|nr:acyl carrier protein [Gemmataceae bacterium]MCS7269852.1 acyl carrier protein [Gemmataceae bacterium]MDW8241905.1 acyl carrier protein [Thermogemmata sp.]